MIKITGTYNEALCYCDTLEDAAREQIESMCNQKIFSGSRIRIMPDVHAGSSCTIGTTMTIQDKVVPSLVGVDIGCGMETVKLAETVIDFEKLDQVIRNTVPSGTNVRQTAHPFTEKLDLSQLKCKAFIDRERAMLSLGTLGGGNHFIEVDQDPAGALYLVIHSGSRYLGHQVATHYQKLTQKRPESPSPEKIRQLIADYKAAGREKEIEKALLKLQADFKAPVPDKDQWLYLEGEDLENYIHDMKIVQDYAALNRQVITHSIIEGMKLRETERFTTIHNYIDTEKMILRKGSVSAQKGEKLLIPINMRDGALICIGKGNPEWNCSAPHGAGRILSRKAASQSLKVEDFKTAMAGIYTTCVTENTLDESPMAYKGLDAILSQIGPTAEVIEQIKPVYNFKGGA